MSEINVQKLAKSYEKPIERAIVYYSMISSLNRLKLQKREIELLAFTAIRGTITPLSAREEFVKQFGSSLATIENMKSKLFKAGLMVKDGDMYRVDPSLHLEFDKPIILRIDLT